MASDLEAVNDRIAAIEQTIAGVVAEHELGENVTSLPGIGTTLAAEFLAHAGTLSIYPSAAALAAHAGLAPISRDSGRRQGHQVRPHRYHRGLRRVFSMSSSAALSHCPRSLAYYVTNGIRERDRSCWCWSDAGAEGSRSPRPAG
ncbi:transposase [Micromonospora palomenae]|nr:transposase [Micromonospora palomenae]